MGLERRPIDLLGVQRSEEQSKLNLYGTLEGLVKSLQSKAEGLTDEQRAVLDDHVALVVFTTQT